MVGACQQNSGIFLVRGGGAGQEICGVRQRARSEMPATKSPGLAAGSERDAGGAEAGLGAARDRTRCRRRPRLGLDEMPTTKSPGQTAGKSLGQAAGSERDAGGGRGWAGSGTSKDRVGGNQINSK